MTKSRIDLVWLLESMEPISLTGVIKQNQYNPGFIQITIKNHSHSSQKNVGLLSWILLQPSEWLDQRSVSAPENLTSNCC